MIATYIHSSKSIAQRFAYALLFSGWVLGISSPSHTKTFAARQKWTFLPPRVLLYLLTFPAVVAVDQRWKAAFRMSVTRKQTRCFWIYRNRGWHCRTCWEYWSPERPCAAIRRALNRYCLCLHPVKCAEFRFFSDVSLEVLRISTTFVNWYNFTNLGYQNVW